MDKKPDKSSQQNPQKAGQAVDSGRTANEDAPGKPLRRSDEGPDNLRQRADWFRRRQGGEK